MAAFPGESEQPLYSTSLPRCFFSLLRSVFLCFPTTGFEAKAFATYGYGIFNVRTHLDACRTHEGGSGTDKSAQELTLRDNKNLLIALPRQVIEPRVFGFESDSLTTELIVRPLYCALFMSMATWLDGCKWLLPLLLHGFKHGHYTCRPCVCGYPRILFIRSKRISNSMITSL